jgi:hypothetical protein
MPFTMTCTNAGCCALQAPYLDPNTNQVFCSKCSKEIKNATVFAKNQMRMAKQFKPKEKKSFSIKCPACGTEDRPILINNDVSCSFCKKKLDKLSESFVLMLKNQLKKADQEI